MNVTIEIPQQIATSPSMIKELKKVLTDYAILWMSRVEKRDFSLSDEYELPEKYEKLCGCISEEKIMSACEDDTKLDYLVKKHL